VIADPRLVAAIVDRLTFNAHIIETGTESYRLRTSRTPPNAPRRQLKRPHPTPTDPHNAALRATQSPDLAASGGARTNEADSGGHRLSTRGANPG
jgi:hypothetical protein